MTSKVDIVLKNGRKREGERGRVGEAINLASISYFGFSFRKFKCFNAVILTLPWDIYNTNVSNNFMHHVPEN